MLSLREISDRLAIERNIRDYARAVDTHDWDLYRQVFLPTVTDLYHIPGQTLDEAIVWLQEVMPNPPTIGYQHFFGSLWIKAACDEAESFVHCFNPQNYLQPDGRTASLHVQFFYYHWRHARTSDGWRIAGRGSGPGALPGRLPERGISRWAAAPVDRADRVLGPAAALGLLPIGDQSACDRIGRYGR